MPSASGNEDPKGMPSVTYGFIGIGRMGFPMALNFRAKMPPASKLVVCDVNKAHVEDFLVQSRSLGPVEVASSPKEVAEHCVSTPRRLF
jgi:3-hydroxyisobutyrate dehydrogenase-like beta-hydroxyacid dehydrogenase